MVIDRVITLAHPEQLLRYAKNKIFGSKINFKVIFENKAQKQK